MSDFFEEIQDSYTAPRVDTSTGRGGRKRKRSNQFRAVPLILALGALSVVGSIGMVLWYRASQPAATPSLFVSKVPLQSVKEGQRLTLPIANLIDPARKDQSRLQMIEGPAGATFDVAKGTFDWAPAEADGSAQHRVVIQVSAAGATEKCEFFIDVVETNLPPVFEGKVDLLAKVGEAGRLSLIAIDKDDPPAKLRYTIENNPPSSSFDESTAELEWLPPAEMAGKSVIVTVTATEDQPQGLSASRRFRIIVEAKPEMLVRAETPDMSLDLSKDKPVNAVSQPIAPPKPNPDEPQVQELLDLYAEKQLRSADRKLFAPASYPVLRKWFAKKFRFDHKKELQEAWGSDTDAMLKWLDEREDFQEELFTAIDPKVDDVTTAMRLLKELKETFPKDIDRYGSLTIATCVVWDKPGGVYKYDYHANRAKAAMPANLASAVDSFRYLVEREKFMEGRILFVPWEYLTLVVNHETPLAERDWAMQTYGPRRVMFGKCYQDCPYDMSMLDSGSKEGRLNNKPYNFVTLKQFGGVCVHQADYASRIGKSIGVPAVSCAGSGRFAGAGHAWVMWVELRSISPTGVGFSIESHGRYRDDHYYVGRLEDPQSGKGITDRDLERRLHAVGANTQGRRHAALVMKVWPMVNEAVKPDFQEQMAYLAQTMKLSPWNERAWKVLAKLAQENSESLTATDRKQLQKAFATLFTTFGGLPDFTTEVFGDLLAFEKNPKKRIGYYNQLLDLYANAQRPDLSFKKLPDLVKLLIEDNRRADAVNMLAAVVKKNANEGKYIPPVLDDLEQLCAGDEKLTKSMVAFYGEFVPLIDMKRGGTVSDYCVAMHERAIEKMEAAGQGAAANLVRQRLAMVKASGKSK